MKHTFKQRLIEFRVWNKAARNFVEYADLDEINISFNKEDGGFGIIYLSQNFRTQLDEPDTDNYILQQFTDLTDKDGKKIFEGDIVKIVKTNEIGFIQYDSKSAAYVLNFNSNIYKKINVDNSLLLGYYALIIVGNIFEHPHLLINNAS